MNKQAQIEAAIKLIAQQKKMKLSQGRVSKIRTQLTGLPQPHHDIVRKTIGSGFSVKEAIDTSDVDYWIDQIVNTLKGRKK